MASVLVVAALVNSLIDLGSLTLDTKPLFPAHPAAAVSVDLPSVTRHLTARIAWGLASIGFSLVTIAAVATALYVLGSCFRELSHRDRVAGAVLIACCVVPFIAIVFLGSDLVLSEPAVTTALRKATLHQTSATAAVSADSLFDNLSYLIFLLLAAAASAAVLWPTTDGKSPALLRRRVARVHALVLIGATALALRALEMYFLYRWPGAWLTGPMAQSVDEIALAVSTAYGSFFTGILASIYLPVAFVLRSRANSLADDAVLGGAEDHEGWLTKSGLRFQPFQEFGRLLAVLAPLLAGGPVAKIIGTFGG
jgi:hypothetical protein